MTEISTREQLYKMSVKPQLRDVARPLGIASISRKNKDELILLILAKQLKEVPSSLIELPPQVKTSSVACGSEEPIRAEKEEAKDPNEFVRLPIQVYEPPKPNPFQCLGCNNCFSSQSNLNKHLKCAKKCNEYKYGNNDEFKPYEGKWPCPYCGRRFTVKTSLVLHFGSCVKFVEEK